MACRRHERKSLSDSGVVGEREVDRCHGVTSWRPLAPPLGACPSAWPLGVAELLDEIIFLEAWRWEHLGVTVAVSARRGARSRGWGACSRARREELAVELQVGATQQRGAFGANGWAQEVVEAALAHLLRIALAQDLDRFPASGWGDARRPQARSKWLRSSLDGTLHFAPLAGGAAPAGCAAAAAATVLRCS